MTEKEAELTLEQRSFMLGSKLDPIPEEFNREYYNIGLEVNIIKRRISSYYEYIAELTRHVDEVKEKIRYSLVTGNVRLEPETKERLEFRFNEAKINYSRYLEIIKIHPELAVQIEEDKKYVDEEIESVKQNYKKLKQRK